MAHASNPAGNIRDQLRAAVASLEHVLPGQAPIQDFVHHNTLHGYQHMSFTEALEASGKLTGAQGYLPDEHYRALYRQGRVSRGDLEQVINETPELDAGQPVFSTRGYNLHRGDVYIAALIHPITPVTACQFNWQLEALGALYSFQPDVDEQSRQRFMNAAEIHGQTDESISIANLWADCLYTLGLDHYILHPEELVDLSDEQAEQMIAELEADRNDATDSRHWMDRLIRKHANHQLQALLDRTGRDLTLRGLLRMLTGQDLLEELRPVLQRYLAAWLDQGVAAWRQEGSQGFYAAWRENASLDPGWIFEDLQDWNDSLEALPEDSLEAVITELQRQHLPESRWPTYLEQLALELPGWSGMFLWRHNHPGYAGLDNVPVDMMDYLAVRLVLERCFARRVCARQWRIAPTLDMIRWYFRDQPAELFVRHTLFNQRLPEYLATRAQQLCRQDNTQTTSDEQWRQAAHMIRIWQQSPAADQPKGYTVYRHAWQLFRLAQHLGLCGPEIQALERAQVTRILDCLERLTPSRTGYLWLQASERHYREQLFSGLIANIGRGRWKHRPVRPEAQLVFCMDDREEGMRRHLEEINPAIETFGAAGFFGVPLNWRGLDNDKIIPLCPVVITPSHEIREIPARDQKTVRARHDRRRDLRIKIRNLLHQEIRRNIFSSAGLIVLATPAVLVTLAGKVFAPLQSGRIMTRLRQAIDLNVRTEVELNAADDRPPATPESPQPGLTDNEQIERVERFLRNIGLTHGFAPIVVMMGHGSGSQNNPHLAAYDCGACSGRHGGPTARVFARMANRPKIRSLLKVRGIEIPDDTWFMAGEHNTCTEDIEWYDLHHLPEQRRANFDALCHDLADARRRHAHERCRRLASAPKNPDQETALAHIQGRALDFSQARPELGHATNAAAFIGRRSMSQGAYFDRRVFLISYDSTQDPDGKIIEALLLANGPVGAGINLEYYFSTVDNDNYGCGSKITHNISGLFGVMEGANSDLRTGLPKQMIEIHEPLRLQVVVEANTGILTEIYQRQPPLQELVGKGWLLLAAQDPDSGEISVFKPESGWTPWRGEVTPPPTVSQSSDWYASHDGPLPPALLEQQEMARHV